MPVALDNYAKLLSEVLPEALETKSQYQSAASRLRDLVAQGRSRSQQETKLMKLLAVLVADYDRRHALPGPVGAPSERLQFLLEHSGKSPSDLLPIFGQKSHVSEVLNGKRKISAEQARKLGKLFRVQPGLFI